MHLSLVFDSGDTSEEPGSGRGEQSDIERSDFQGAQGHSRQSLLAQTSEPRHPSVLHRGSRAAETGTVSC